MSTFTPETPLERAVHAGDVAATLDLLRSLCADERAAKRAVVMRLHQLARDARYQADSEAGTIWGGKPTSEQQRALGVAVLLCATAADVAETGVDEADLIRYGREFQPRSLQGLGDAELKISPMRIWRVQQLIAAGLIPRPDSEDYVLGLMALPRAIRSPSTMASLLEADPGLKPVLLKVFDIEGNGEYSLASSDKYNHAPKHAWGHILMSLVEDGTTTREVLLDKTLGALEKDWPQFRSGWFSRFHAELKPDAAAMRLHLQRYLALCHSRIPPTVTLALDALKAMDAARPLPGAELLEALGPVMSSSVKAQVGAAIKLLDAVVKREPALARRASAALSQGLAHDSAPLQKDVLDRLSKWGVNAEDIERLRSFLPGIAAVNAAALAKLIGTDAKPTHSTEPDAPAAASPVAQRVGVLDESRKLQPLSDLGELVERIAYVFENDIDVDEFERVLAQLVACAPLDAADRRMFSPVMKRADKMRKPIAHALARLLVFVMEGQRLAPVLFTDPGSETTVMDVLSRRIDELIEVAAQGKKLLPLSALTHRRGFIDPLVFVERVDAHQRHGVVSSQGEQVSGLLRLAGESASKALEPARQLQDTPFTRALRYALGDDVKPGEDAALFCAAARIRHPKTDDTALLKAFGDLGPDGPRAACYSWLTSSSSHTADGVTYHHHHLQVDVSPTPPTVSGLLAVQRHPAPRPARSYFDWHSFGGSDEAAILYSASLLPSDLEAFFAEGSRAIGNNLDWWEAQWQNKAYLSLLLDPTVALSSKMPLLLLALGLFGKEPGQAAMAVDALVQSHVEGRLDADALAATVRDLLATPLAKTARLHKSLLAATRADAAMRGVVFDLICTALAASPEEPPKDTALLLQLLIELKIAGRLELKPQAHEAIKALKLSGKGKALQAEVLQPH